MKGNVNNLKVIEQEIRSSLKKISKENQAQADYLYKIKKDLQYNPEDSDNKIIRILSEIRNTLNATKEFQYRNKDLLASVQNSDLKLLKYQKKAINSYNSVLGIKNDLDIMNNRIQTEIADVKNQVKIIDRYQQQNEAIIENITKKLKRFNSLDHKERSLYEKNKKLKKKAKDLREKIDSIETDVRKEKRLRDKMKKNKRSK